MTARLRNCERYGNSWPCPNIKTPSRHLSGGYEENHENLRTVTVMTKTQTELLPKQKSKVLLLAPIC